MLALKASAIWLLILVCAVLNGALRERFLVPALGAVPAQVVSGLLLSLCILGASAALIPWLGPRQASAYLALGVFWLVLTVAFEFLFGHFVLHLPRAQLLAAYTFEGGNLWPLVLVVTTLAPWLAAHLRGLLPAAAN